MRLNPAARLMLGSTFLFSLMQVCVKALPRIPAHEIVFFRALVTLVISYVMLRRAGISPEGNARGLLVARGLAGMAGLTLFFHTVQSMPLASAATVQYLAPMFTLALAGLILKERAHGARFLYFGIAFAGVALVKGFDPRVSALDLGLGVLGAFFSGVAYNLVRKLKDTDHPLVVVFYFPLVVVPTVGAYSALHWVQPEGWEWLGLLAVGVATQFAQVFMTRAYQLERADRVAHYSYVGALFAIAFGYGIFGEEIPAGTFAGIALVLAGVVLATVSRR